MIQECSSNFFPTALGIRKPRHATHTATLTGEIGGKLENGDGSRHVVCMQKTTAEPMEPSEQFCPNLDVLRKRPRLEQGNIMIHDRKRQRYRCKTCKQTFSARRGTMFEGLRTATELVVIVVTLLAFGCPVQAIVQAYGLDERTVASWRDRAGKQCQRVHQAIVEQGQLDLIHVQADEIRVKARSMVAWMGLAMMVSTRLWLGGVVSPPVIRVWRIGCCSRCEPALRRPARCWSAPMAGRLPQQYQTGVSRQGETNSGRGRASLQVWSGLHIGTVIRHTGDKRLREVVRQMSHGSDGASDAPLASVQRAGKCSTPSRTSNG